MSRAPRMNETQKAVLAFVLLLAMLAVAFPPYEEQVYSPVNGTIFRSTDRGYAFIAAPPEPIANIVGPVRVRIAYERFGGTLAVIGLFGAFSYIITLLAGGSRRTQPQAAVPRSSPSPLTAGVIADSHLHRLADVEEPAACPEVATAVSEQPLEHAAAPEEQRKRPILVWIISGWMIGGTGIMFLLQYLVLTHQIPGLPPSVYIPNPVDLFIQIGTGVVNLAYGVSLFRLSKRAYPLIAFLLVVNIGYTGFDYITNPEFRATVGQTGAIGMLLGWGLLWAIAAYTARLRDRGVLR